MPPKKMTNLDNAEEKRDRIDKGVNMISLKSETESATRMKSERVFHNLEPKYWNVEVHKK